MKTPLLIDRGRIFLALLSGLMMSAAFPKIGADWIAWVALVPFFLSLRNLDGAGEALRLGLFAGLAHYLSLVYWLAYTMNTYGNLPYTLNIPILFLFALYLSMFWAAFSVVVYRTCHRPWILLISAPAAWVGLEFLRSVLFTGFPWEMLGHCMYRRQILIQICDMTGAYGLSAIVVLCNGAVLTGMLWILGKDWQGHPISGRSALSAAVISIAAMVVCVGYGMWRSDDLYRQMANRPHLRVAVVQGNINQAIKWDPAHQVASIEKYIRLSKTARRLTPDLVVWPETATPFYFPMQPRLTRKVIEGVRGTGTDFLFGSPSYVATGNDHAYFNSAYLVLSSGTVAGRYDKAHLVPFGEYVPLKKWLPFLGKIVAQVGDFRSGSPGQVLAWDKGGIGVLICYEAIFPELSRAMAANGASLLVNITNDAWYGRSSAPFQHFSMSVFRAVENRRSLVRAANTGISGFIDPVGRILQTTPLFEDAVIGQSLPVLEQTSTYTRRGDVFALACVVISLLLLGLSMGHRKPHG
ncbi:Apolipoprotein N-acyltransferase / Copper homeostasis protein CutE [Olavius algarvensis associated proteobacterium Delta 3]|nr:Apolipoprotein N-acyltransferase / Copper homeostasis protein CutE [Olavius algarvensis associated proteobacterium Delta 3]